MKLLLDGTVSCFVSRFTHIHARTRQTKSGFYTTNWQRVAAKPPHGRVLTQSIACMCVCAVHTVTFLPITHSHCTHFAFSRSSKQSCIVFALCDLYSILLATNHTNHSVSSFYTQFRNEALQCLNASQFFDKLINEIVVFLRASTGLLFCIYGAILYINSTHFVAVLSQSY